MLSGKVLESATNYLKGHPEEVARILRSSFGLRFESHRRVSLVGGATM